MTKEVFDMEKADLDQLIMQLKANLKAGLVKITDLSVDMATIGMYQ
jgi:hypothetical protein